MIIYAAADLVYLEKFSIPFIESSLTHGHEVVITPIFREGDRSYEWRWTQLNRRFEKFRGKGLHFKICDIDEIIQNAKENGKIIDLKSLWTAIRFIMLPEIIEKYGNVLVLDIDSIIRKPIVIEGDVGLYMREDNTVGENEYELKAMKLAAGAVYGTKESKAFFTTVAEKLRVADFTWFVDQYILYDEYTKSRVSLTNFTDLSKLNLIDWEFTENSSVWTGKGPRKDSAEFQAEMSKYD